MWQPKSRKVISYLQPKQLSKEVGPQICDDDVESNACPQHEANHAEKRENVSRKYKQTLFHSWGRISSLQRHLTSIPQVLCLVFHKHEKLEVREKGRQISNPKPNTFLKLFFTHLTIKVVHFLLNSIFKTFLWQELFQSVLTVSCRFLDFSFNFA